MSRSVYAEAGVSLEDFGTADLVEELELRGGWYKDILYSIYHKRRMGMDYQQDLDNLIYQSLGRML